MSSTLIIGLEMSLVFGGVLGLAVFEVMRLRRDKKKSQDARSSPKPHASPE